MKTKVRSGRFLSATGLSLLFCVILLSCLIPGSAAQASSVDAVATVNGAAYATLSDACAAAAGTAYPIVLQKDVTASEFHIKAAVTMDLNGHTITAGSGAQMAFWVENGGSLTLSGTGTVEGGNQKFGIIYVAAGGSLTLLDNVTLTGNTATNGGAVYNFGTFSMKGGTISNTTATEYGGAVYNYDTFTMDGGTISGSTAGYGGGAVYNAKSFTMNGGSMIGTSTSWYGGAVHNGGTFIMNGGDLSDTTAIYYGGAIYTSSAFTMKKGSITNAKATYGSWSGKYGGGGIYLAKGTAKLEDGKISGCSVSTRADTEAAFISTPARRLP